MVLVFMYLYYYGFWFDYNKVLTFQVNCKLSVNYIIQLSFYSFYYTSKGIYVFFVNYFILRLNIKVLESFYVFLYFRRLDYLQRMFLFGYRLYNESLINFRKGNPTLVLLYWKIKTSYNMVTKIDHVFRPFIIFSIIYLSFFNLIVINVRSTNTCIFRCS